MSRCSLSRPGNSMICRIGCPVGIAVQRGGMGTNAAVGDVALILSTGSDFRDDGKVRLKKAMRSVIDPVGLSDATFHILELVHCVVPGVDGFDFYALAFEGSGAMRLKPRADDGVEISRAPSVERFHYFGPIKGVRGQAQFLEYHLPGRRHQ